MVEVSVCFMKVPACADSTVMMSNGIGGVGNMTLNETTLLFDSA